MPSPKSVASYLKPHKLKSLARSRWPQLVVIVVGVAAIGTVLVAQNFAVPLNPEREDLKHGVLFTGLQYQTSGPCKGTYQAVNYHGRHKIGGQSIACTHPDPAPTGRNLATYKLNGNSFAHPPQGGVNKSPTSSVANDVWYANSLAGTTGQSPLLCYGTGQDGPRVQALYVHPSNYDNLGSYYGGFNVIAQSVQQVFAQSGQASGGGAAGLRFATNSDCSLNIADVGINTSTTNINDWGSLSTTLENMGYSSVDRKYLVWVDYNSSSPCGLGGLDSDSQPGSANANNYGPSFAMVWSGCWNYGEPHEIGHNLGAVQLDAPHSTGHWHCTDEHDDMCYADYPGVSTYIACSNTARVYYYDCNNDDYFSTNPNPGGYLATHWNIAHSRFVALSAKNLGTVTIGTDHAVWFHNWNSTTGWGSWQSLGGYATSAAAIASWGPNRLDVFVRGVDYQLYHKSFSGGSWSGWDMLGGALTTAPAVASWGPNRLDVFVRGSDNQMYHKSWNGAWNGWEPLGGNLTSTPAVASWGPNRLDVFVRGPDNQLYHKWWSGSGWDGWEALGGNLTTAPAVASWGPNRLDVFVRGIDFTMYHKSWSGAWSGWDDIGGYLTSDPAATSYQSNQIDVLVNGIGNILYHKSWNGAWSGWTALNSDPAYGRTAVTNTSSYAPGEAGWYNF